MNKKDFFTLLKDGFYYLIYLLVIILLYFIIFRGSLGWPLTDSLQSFVPILVIFFILIIYPFLASAKPVIKFYLLNKSHNKRNIRNKYNHVSLIVLISFFIMVSVGNIESVVANRDLEGPKNTVKSRDKNRHSKFFWLRFTILLTAVNETLLITLQDRK